MRTLSEFLRLHNERVSSLLEETKRAEEELWNLPYSAFSSFGRRSLEEEKGSRERAIHRLYEELEEVKNRTIIVTYEYEISGKTSLSLEGNEVKIMQTIPRKMVRTEKTKACLLENICCWDMPIYDGRRRPDAVFVEYDFNGGGE